MPSPLAPSSPLELCRKWKDADPPSGRNFNVFGLATHLLSTTRGCQEFSIIHLEQSRLSCSNSEIESLFCSSCRFRWRELDLSLESGNGVKHTQHVWLIEVWVSKKSTGNSDYSQRVPSRNASRNTYTCIDPTVEATSIHSLGQVKPHQHRRNHQIGDRCCVHVLYGQYLTHEC
jgi:hypothetical protein